MDLIGDYKPQFYDKTGFQVEEMIESRKSSFMTAGKKSVSYSEFLDIQKTYPKTSNIKDDSATLKEKLLKDIKVPSFYTDVADLQDLVLYQGAHFIDKPKYERQEQIMCAIDGLVSIALVPHVNRQEVYAGQLKEKGSIYYDSKLTDEE